MNSKIYVKNGEFVQFVYGTGTYTIVWDENGKYKYNTVPWQIGGGSSVTYPDLTKEEMESAKKLD